MVLEREELMLNAKSKKCIVIFIFILLICLLITFVWCTINDKEEVLRMSIGEGLEYYYVLYENGELIVESGLAKYSDISKKRYISKKDVSGIEVYYYEKVKLKVEDVEKIKQLAKALDYCTNDTSRVFDTVHAKFYYNGKSIILNDLSRHPSVEALVKELIALSPKRLDLKQLAPA